MPLIDRVVLRDGDLVITSPPYGGGSGAYSPRSTYRDACAAAVRGLLGDHVIVIDTEPQGERIYELGLVRLSYGYIEAVEGYQVDPGREVLPLRAANGRKTAIAEMVAGAGSFADHVAHMYNFVAGHRLFVGWNVHGDRDRLLGELGRHRLPHSPTEWFDARDLYQLAVRGGSAPGLEKAYNAFFSTPWRQEHYALDDAIRTAHLICGTSLAAVADTRRAEDLQTQKGRLGAEWPLLPAISEPRRRHPLPPAPGLPSWARVKLTMWRETNGLPMLSEPHSLFSTVGHDHEQRKQRWREQHAQRTRQLAASGIAGTIQLPMPPNVRVEHRPSAGGRSAASAG